MKMERIVEGNPIVDLDNPSLEALSLVLRHREMWPKGFSWSYSSCRRCSMGLASRLWKEFRLSRAIDCATGSARGIAKLLGLTEEDSANIFINAAETRGWSVSQMCKITPEMVADDIDAYLARKALASTA